MGSMEINLSDLLARLRTMDRRMLGLMAAGAVLLLYFAVMGSQYWGQVRTYQALSAQYQNMLQTIDRAARAPSAPQNELSAAQAHLDQTKAKFTVDNPDEIIVIVSNVASQSHVTMSSFSSAPAGTQADNGITYQLQRVSVRVDGSTPNIEGFIQNMSNTMAGVPTSVNLSGFGQNPFATITFTLHLLPTTGGKK